LKKEECWVVGKGRKGGKKLYNAKSVYKAVKKSRDRPTNGATRN